MPQSYTRILLHTVFSTKYRRPTIRPHIEGRLHAYMKSRLYRQGAIVVEINGALDHVHVLHSLPRTKTLSKLVEDMKSCSSGWMAKQGYVDFWWQDGYYSHSVDHKDCERVRRYIRRQKKHHYGSLDNYLTTAKLTFKDELLSLLNEYGMEYNEKFLFPEDPEHKRVNSDGNIDAIGNQREP